MTTLGQPSSTQTLLANVNIDELSVTCATGTTLTGLASGSFTSGASNTALANVTGMSAALVPGTYLMEGYFVVSAAATPGIKLAMTYSGTTTTFLSDTWVYNTSTLTAEQNATSIGTFYTAAGAATVVEFGGVIVVTTAGTAQVQAAQSVSNATPTTVANNSYICFTRVV